MFSQYRKLNLKLLRVYQAKEKECSCPEGIRCPQPGKHPAPWNGEQNKGVYNATFDYQDTDFEGYNVGVATGDGLLVVDVDPRNNGHHTWAAISEGETIPNTLLVQTGGGGVHYYFRIPESFAMRNLTAKGIDFQYSGKYAVAPPSRHHSGNDYHIEDYEDEDDLIIAEAPEWLLKYLKTQLQTIEECSIEFNGQPIEPTSWEWNWIDEILAKLDPDIPYEQWLAVGMGLHATGDKRAFRIWDDWSKKGEKYVRYETERKWKSFKTVSGKIHTYKWVFALADIYGIDFGKDNFEINLRPVIRAKTIEEIISESGEILSDLCVTLRARSRIDRAEFSLASSLAILSACVQGAYSGPNDLSLNLYQWCAGPAACGKDSYIKNSTEILRQLNSSLIADRYNSIAGFRVMMMGYNSRIDIRDEFHDDYLQMVGTRNEYLKEVLKDYKVLFNTPSRLNPVIIKASTTPAVECPFYSLFVFSTVSGLNTCSQGDFLTSGMGSRFLFWIVDQAEHEQWPKEAHLKSSVRDALRRFSTLGLTPAGRGNSNASEVVQQIQDSFKANGGKVKPWVHMAQTAPKRVVTCSDAVQKAIDNDNRETRKAMQEGGKDDALQSIMGRKSQLALRVACLRALSDSREEISISDYEWAQAICTININQINKHFALNVGATRWDTEAEERSRRVLRIIKQVSGQGGKLVGKADIMKNKVMEPRQFDTALMILIDTGAILAIDKAGRRVYPVKVERGLRFTWNPEAE